jgi:hypothetical protein
MNYNRGCYRQPTACGCAPERNYAANRRTSDKCGCSYTPRSYANTEEMNYKLGMVYSPYQNWQNLYPCDKGFTEGTIFMELNKPFEGYKNGKGGCCLL